MKDRGRIRNRILGRVRSRGRRERASAFSGSVADPEPAFYASRNLYLTGRHLEVALTTKPQRGLIARVIDHDGSVGAWFCTNGYALNFNWDSNSDEFLRHSPETGGLHLRG